MSFYHSFVYSLLSYGVPVWGGSLLNYRCTRIHSLFKRILLNLFTWHFPHDSFFQICERLVILPPIEIYKYNVMILYYNIKFRHFLPAIEFRENVSTHDFRFPNQLFAPQPRTNAYKMNFQFCIPTI